MTNYIAKKMIYKNLAVRFEKAASLLAGIPLILITLFRLGSIFWEGFWYADLPSYIGLIWLVGAFVAISQIAIFVYGQRMPFKMIMQVAERAAVYPLPTKSTYAYCGLMAIIKISAGLFTANTFAEPAFLNSVTMIYIIAYTICNITAATLAILIVSNSGKCIDIAENNDNELCLREKLRKAILLVTCVVVLGVGHLLLKGSWHPSLSRMEHGFVTNRDLILEITEHLIQFPFERIYVREDNYREHLLSIKAGDEKIIATLEVLFNRGYQEVWKKDGMIGFRRWSDLRTSWGIIYSVEGRIPDETDIVHLVKLEPLEGADGWFYYIDSYNIWRARNQN